MAFARFSFIKRAENRKTPGQVGGSVHPEWLSYAKFVIRKELEYVKSMMLANCQNKL